MEAPDCTFSHVALVLLLSGRGVPLVQHVVFATHLHAWELFFVSSIFLSVLGLVAAGAAGVMGSIRGLSPAELVVTPAGRWVRLAVVEWVTYRSV